MGATRPASVFSAAPSRAIEKGGKYGRYLIIAAYFSRVSRDASIRGYVCTFGLSSRTRLNPDLS
jgi:hypothetical protein